MYREYATKHGYTRRTYAHHKPIQIKPQSEFLLDAKARLTEILGLDDYYDWACTIPYHILMNETEYIARIEAKIEELTAEECSCVLPDQACPACIKAASTNLDPEELPY